MGTPTGVEIVTVPNAANSYQIVDVGHAGGVDLTAIKAGKTYTLSFWAKSISGQTSPSVDIRHSDGTATIIINQFFTITTTATRYSVTFVAAVDGDALHGIRFNSPTSTATGIDYQVAGLQLELGSVATPLTWGDATHLGSSESGHFWAQIGGTTQGIQSGSAKNMIAGQGVASIDLGTPDVSIETLTTVAGGMTGIGLRIADFTNFVSVNFRATSAGGQSTITKTVAGTTTSIATFAAIPDTGAKLRVDCVGTTITAYVNDVQVTTVTDASLDVTTTKHGITPNNIVPLYDYVTFKVPVAGGDGAAMPVWPDLSGNYRHAVQPVAAKRPLLRKASPNLLSLNQATAEIDATTGVGVDGAGTVVRSTAQAAQGSASFLVTVTTAGQSPGVSTLPARTPVTPGQTYTALASFRMSTATTRFCGVKIRWVDAGGAQVGSTQFGTSIQPGTGGWTVSSCTAVAPVGAVTGYAVAAFNDGSTALNDAVHVDMMSLAVGSSTTWVPPVTLPNALPAVQFDGVDDWLTAGANFAWDKSTVFLVHAVTGKAGNPTQMPFQAANGDIHSLYYSAPASAFAIFDAGLSASAGGSPNGTWHEQTGTYDSPGLGVSLDGGAVTNTAALTVPSGIGFSIGSDSTGARSMLGTLAAVVVFTRVLTATERQQIEAYLKAKFGTP
jgi:hypothetical protein